MKTAKEYSDTAKREVSVDAMPWRQRMKLAKAKFHRSQNR